MFHPMKLAGLALTAILVGSPHVTETPNPVSPGVGSWQDPSGPGAAAPLQEVQFSPATRVFSDAPGCIAHLTALVSASVPPTYVAAAGPYVIASQDLRAHRVRARDRGHEIEEYRCQAAALSSRRWTHSMSEVKPITLDDIGKMSFPGP